MSLKAAEAGMLVRFVVDLLVKLGGPGKFGLPVICAGESLVRYMSVMREIEVVPTDVQYNDMLNASQVHLTSCRACGIAFVPQHHVLARMTVRTHGLHTAVHFDPPPPIRQRMRPLPRALLGAEVVE
eukprot:8444742-Pyramimonas_sp.AAC.1